MVSITLPPSSFVESRFVAGQQIACPPDTICLCDEGLILISTFYHSGEKGVLGIVSAGLPFGSPLTMVAPYTATALTGGKLRTIALADLHRSPQLSQQFVFSLIERLRTTEAFLAIVNQRRVGERFTAFLGLLACRVGRETEQGILLEIRLTHQQIASAINATRVTVTRLMRRYRNLEIIADQQQHILIRDLFKLKHHPQALRPPQPVDFG